MRFAAEKVFALCLALTPLGCNEGDDDSSEDDGAGETDGETDGDAQWASLAERPCPDDDFLSYENFGEPFLLTYCTGCHHGDRPESERQKAPANVNFNDVANVRMWAERIWARSGDQNETMPPAGQAGLEERTLLGEWLACGAPTDADLE